MTGMIRSILLSLLIVICLDYCYAQIGNNMCEGALPFCTGTSYSFPAGVNAGNGQPGPYYSCLSMTPNPAWYYMKIAMPGTIQITMHSEPANDIDFCCWGPFDSQNVCGQLTNNKVVDCSYSMAATEICDIANAVAGKFYILIITNYSNDPCNIIFSQTGGLGATDCTILPPAATSNGPLCVGETLQLSAANMNNAMYHWNGPDGWASNVQNPVRNNVQLSMAGTYSLFVTVNGQPSADTNYTNVAVQEKPVAFLTGGETICQGDSAELIISCQNSPPWNVTLSATGQLPVTLAIASSPFSYFVKPSTTTTYTLSSVSNEICDGMASGSANINVNARPVVNFTVDNTCSGSPTSFSDVSLLLNGYISSWHWDFDSYGDTSNIQNPVYTFPSGGQYNVLLRVSSDNGCTNETVKTVYIQPSPVTDAGSDKSIPYGTSTSLQGIVSGGTGVYSYHWEPANLLVNPDVLNPATINITQTTDFTLSATDAVNGCSTSDQMTLTITGGPMGVQLFANPPAVCIGSSTTINVQAGGGSGNYIYSWSSDPQGFTSTLEDITVQPVVTTTYLLTISDGFSTLTRALTITVHQNPVVIAGDPQSIPNGTTTTLSGYAVSNAPPITYQWDPASLVVNPSDPSTLTQLLTSTTSFTLYATDNNGCLSSNNVLITVTGGPLMVHPQAVSSPVCVGEPTRLLPMSEGGSGNYSYLWTAPGGFQSDESEPLVTPQATTTYHLLVNDGYTQYVGDVTVTVNLLPQVNLIPAGAHILNADTILACVFDTLTLSAANPNAEYYWSNGATTPEILSATTGISFDLLSYSVEVTNTLTGCANSGTITIMYTYGECSYGLQDPDRNEELSIHPSPGDGLYTCRLRKADQLRIAEAFSIQGSNIWRKDIPANLTGDITIDIRQKPAGVYFLRISGNDGNQVVRIIKR